MSKKTLHVALAFVITYGILWTIEATIGIIASTIVAGILMIGFGLLLYWARS